MTARSLLSLSLCAAAAAVDYDVIVYGATPAGVLAAIGAANETTRVLLVHYLGHIGGMSAGGLGKTDVGNQDVIAAGAAQFFNTYCYCAKPTGCAPGNATGYLCTLLTPRTAEDTFEYMVAQTHGAVTLMKSMTLQAVSKSGSTLSSVTFVPTSYAESHPELPVGLGAKPVDSRTIEGAQTFTASMFIDGTYEGDLLAAAGVSYTVGREGQSQYNESYAGRLAAPNSIGGHQFTVPVSPYDAPGQLSPLISHGNSGVPGQADSRVQAYNFRLCLTKNSTNQAPLTAPPGYDASFWDILIRFIQAANKTSATDFFNIGDVGLGKTDFNNNGAISTDVIGWADAWPEATPAQRADLWGYHKNYTQGLIYTLATDPRVPDSIRTGMSAWGYCADEFTDNSNWPWQLYVREGRRMVSDFVFTQADREANKVKPDCVGAYSYNIDTHNAQRFVQLTNGVTWTYNEGDVEKDGNLGPGSMPYRMMVPKRAEATNLIVPTACSASHIGFGTIRLEPQWMMLGQAAGVAAAQALKAGQAVQDVDVTALQARLVQLGAKLKYCNGTA